MESNDLFSHPEEHHAKPATASSEEVQAPAFSDRPQHDTPAAPQHS
jgi:hypothetical protein